MHIHIKTTQVSDVSPTLLLTEEPKLYPSQTPSRLNQAQNRSQRGRQVSHCCIPAPEGAQHTEEAEPGLGCWPGVLLHRPSLSAHSSFHPQLTATQREASENPPVTPTNCNSSFLTLCELCSLHPALLKQSRLGEEPDVKNGSRSHGGMLLTAFLPTACSACFLTGHRTTCPGPTPAIVI